MRVSLWIVLERATNVGCLAAVAVMLWVAATGGLRVESGVDGRRLPQVAEDVHDTTQLGNHWKGGAGAQLVLIEFADFQCPFCARFAAVVLPDIEKAFVETGKIRYDFRHLPLPSHPLAFHTSQASECAAAQGKFWDMHDWLFAHPDRQNRQDIITRLRAIRPLPSYDTCLNDSSVQVTADRDEAIRLGVRATPTFLVGRVQPNGSDVTLLKKINGLQSFEVFRSTLVAILATTPS